jgi:nicotinamidase-related amidase
LEPKTTALVFTDLHNDFLAQDGKAYGLLKESLVRSNTAENIERLLSAAKTVGMKVFVSPHYYYPHDHRWAAPVTPGGPSAQNRTRESERSLEPR